MNTETLIPPIDVLDDFKSLQAAVHEDDSGEKTRLIVRYFDDAAAKSQEMQLHADGSEEREFARLISEAFQAARRIVLAAWERSHTTTLAH
jgi:hypothetical protein